YKLNTLKVHFKMESSALKLHKIGIFGIIFCVIFLFAMALLPIEFTDDGYKQIFALIIWFGLPLFMIFTTFDIPYLKESKFGKKARLVLTLALAALTFCIFFFYMLASTMCGYVIDEILFKKKNSNQQVIIRHQDCGATDSGGAPKELIHITPIGFLQIFQKVDTNTLNRSEWIKP
ncbi:MAG: hypothetical protein V4642_12160, partial [Bacteroidota bacterium]